MPVKMRLNSLFSSLSVLIIVIMLPLPSCNSRGIGVGSSNNVDDDYHVDMPTESPDLVEVFNPLEWGSQSLLSRQITVESINLLTKVKLRYARTQIRIKLKNKHDRELQTEFKLILPENAFFTIFELRIESKPISYRAAIVEKEDARRRYHFARVRNNGTIAAGYIELANSNGVEGVAYNLKFSLPPRESIHSILVYERQLDRFLGMYSDKLQIFPGNPLQINGVQIGTVKFVVDVEEMGAIDLLRCTPEIEKHYVNCTSKEKLKQKPGVNQYQFRGLCWQQRNLSAGVLEKVPFQFVYQLEKRNETTTAVIISQNHGNYHFVHLFTPPNLPRVRKHVVFLLDVSDSMYGQKLDQVKWSMTEILDDLGPDDFFNIIAFSNDISIWTKFRGERKQCPYPFPVTEESKASAEVFIKEKLHAHGTTNIFLGLTEAFELIRQFNPDFPSCEQAKKIKSQRVVREQIPEKLPPNVESMIFFLSDGRPTSGPRDTDALLKHFYNEDRRLSGNNSNTGIPAVPIHTIAYGEDADMDFLRLLSHNSRGATKVIEIESGAGVELSNFYAEVSSQILSHVKTFFENKSNGTNARVLSYPVVVYSGQEVITTGLIAPGKNHSFSSADYRWSTEAVGKTGKLVYNSPVYDCTTLETTVGKCVERIDYFLRRFQAYQLLQKWLERDKMVQQGYICPNSYHQQFDDLIMQKMLDYEKATSDELSTGSVEKVAGDPECYNIYRQRVIELALKYEFVTPYTSFILTAENVDNGLKSGGTPAPASADTQESGENFVSRQNSVNFPQYEKLVIIGSSGSPLNGKRLRAPTSKLAQLKAEPREELVPTSDKLVRVEGHLTVNELNQNAVANWNSTNLSSANVTNDNNTSHWPSFTMFVRKHVIELENILPSTSVALSG